ncbi:MAG: formylmethanofuran dehydrogenase subunit C [Planctomycetota bacterium]|nr:formylmethanofuran dehydrogenase subunit C [Planctomycetota bacterium]
MPLVLRIRQTTTIPLEVETIRIETAREQTADAVLGTLIQYGNQQVPLGEFFTAEGSASDEQIVWEGDCSKVKLIGALHNRGTIRVEGNAGMHLGAEMTGGEIIVHGNAADWVGAEMHGGRIHIHGHAGHLVGAVYRGGRRGMTGGEILIEGDAGNEIGQTMRRGLIAVGGKAGDAIGFSMIAGTVLVFGEPGIRHGAGMKRGTIGLLSESSYPDLLPTFRYCTTYRPNFLRIYLKALQQRGFPVPEHCWTTRFHRFAGDFLEDGKGEILISENALSV